MKKEDLEKYSSPYSFRYRRSLCFLSWSYALVLSNIMSHI